MRERLVELMRQAEFAYLDFSKMNPCEKSLKDFTADYLIANGVIVPPCKVGDVVYEVLPKVGFIRSDKVVGFHLGKFPDIRGHKRKEYLICYSDYSLTHIDIDKFGKTVFLTKEEAEEALKRKGVGK